jgi:hypothetical protein
MRNREARKVAKAIMENFKVKVDFSEWTMWYNLFLETEVDEEELRTFVEDYIDNEMGMHSWEQMNVFSGGSVTIYKQAQKW